MNLRPYLESAKQRIDTTLEGLLPPAEGPAATVLEAMRYAVMAGGKRLRPIVALAACEACGGDPELALEPAAALELLHTYSLIHDDLPAMDDDELRRGRPTVHRAFGEAEAILAGDALQTLAFEILATRPRGDEYRQRRLEATAALASRAGIAGMVGGQVADLRGEREVADADSLRWTHLHKTAALFAASAEIGGIHAGAGPAVRGALSRYGEALGLAFQIADDVLDCTASARTLGKTPGKDDRLGKATYPALYGLDASRREAERLAGEAEQTLSAHGLGGEVMGELARFAVSRSQ